MTEVLHHYDTMTELVAVPRPAYPETREILGEERPYPERERHFNEGYLDLAWAIQAANGIKWACDNSYNVALNMMRGCLLDDKYTAAQDLLNEPWPVDKRRHNLPLDIRYTQEGFTDETTGEWRPMTRDEYVQVYGITPELADPGRWMVDMRSLRDIYLQFRRPAEFVEMQREDGTITRELLHQESFAVDQFGNDEMWLIDTVLAMASLDERP